MEDRMPQQEKGVSWDDLRTRNIFKFHISRELLFYKKQVKLCLQENEKVKNPATMLMYHLRKILATNSLLNSFSYKMSSI